jgi:hypothetical protein
LERASSSLREDSFSGKGGRRATDLVLKHLSSNRVYWFSKVISEAGVAVVPADHKTSQARALERASARCNNLAWPNDPEITSENRSNANHGRASLLTFLTSDSATSTGPEVSNER